MDFACVAPVKGIGDPTLEVTFARLVIGRARIISRWRRGTRKGEWLMELRRRLLRPSFCLCRFLRFGRDLDPFHVQWQRLVLEVLGSALLHLMILPLTSHHS